MIVAVGLLSLIVVGIPMVRWIHGPIGGGLLAGEAFLFGSGWCSVVMLGLSLTGAGWSPAGIATAVLAPSFAAWFLLSRRSHNTNLTGMPGAASGATGAASSPDSTRSLVLSPIVVLAALLDIISVLLVIAYVRFSTIAPLWEWDFWAIWGLKARQFFENGGIDWLFLQNPDNAFLHPDYPVLTPMLFDFFAVMGGRWDDQSIGLLYPAFAVALAAITRHVIDEELNSRLATSAVTLGMLGVAANPLIGLADGPLIAFAATGTLLVRRGWRITDMAGARNLEARRDVWAGSILLGFAAFTKNEGIALIAAIALASALTMRGSRRRLLELWPALVLPMVWKVAVMAHGLHSYFERGGGATRVIDRLGNPGPIVEAVLATTGRPLFVVAMLIALLIGFRWIVRSEAFLLLTASILTGFYFVAYLATPFDPVWQITTSWPRIALHLAALFLYPGVLAVAQVSRHDGQDRSERNPPLNRI